MPRPRLRRNMMGTLKPTGVIPHLVENVRRALDAEGFNSIKIVESGGFTPQKIRSFERSGVPVESAHFDFTADMIATNVDGERRECAK